MSDDFSARLALPYLAAGQMQKHVTLNAALTRLDALLQTLAVSRTITAQPEGPADGALYILPEGGRLIGRVLSPRPVSPDSRLKACGFAVRAVKAPPGSPGGAFYWLTHRIRAIHSMSRRATRRGG